MFARIMSSMKYIIIRIMRLIVQIHKTLSALESIYPKEKYDKKKRKKKKIYRGFAMNNSDVRSCSTADHWQNSLGFLLFFFGFPFLHTPKFFHVFFVPFFFFCVREGILARIHAGSCKSRV